MRVSKTGDWTITSIVIPRKKDLYDYVRLEDMKELRDAAGLEHVQTISADGPADYMRRELNAMSEEMFAKFIEYHLSTCERPERLAPGRTQWIY